jgi:WD40 repeat protein
MKTRLLAIVILSCAYAGLFGISVRAQTSPLQTSSYEHNLSKPRLVVQTGHSEGITALVFSNDGRLLVTNDMAGVVKAWDVQTGEELAGFDSCLNSRAIVGTEQTILIPTCDSKIVGRSFTEVYDLASLEKIRILPGLPAAVSSDGKFVATFDNDSRTADGAYLERRPKLVAAAFTPGVSPSSCPVVVWDLLTGKKILGTTDFYPSAKVSFSGDNKFIAVSEQHTLGDPKTTEVWRIADKKYLGEFAGSFEGIDASGTQLTTKVDRWSQIEKVSVESIHGDRITLNAMVAPLGNAMAHGHPVLEPRTLLVRLVESRAEPNVEMRVVDKEAGVDEAIAEVIGGDARTVRLDDFFVVGEPAKVADLQGRRWAAKTWNLQTGKELSSEIIVGASSRAAASLLKDIAPPMLEGERWVRSPDGEKIAATWGLAEDGQLAIFDAATGDVLHRLAGTSLNVFSVSVSPDGKTLAAGSWDSHVKLWDLAAGRQAGEFHTMARRPFATFSPDGKTLAACEGFREKGRTIFLWELGSNSKREIPNGPRECSSIRFSYDGKIVGTSEQYGGVEFWNPDSPSSVPSLPKSDDFAFSPSSAIFALSTNGAVSIRDLSSSAELLSIPASSPLAFSPDAKLIAGYNFRSRKIGVWDVKTGQLVQELSDDIASFGNSLKSLTFSPDGKLLVSLLGDRTRVQVWNLSTGRGIQLVGHHGTVWCAAFSADGKFLFTGGDDTTIKIWNPETGKELASLVSFGDSDWAAVDPQGRFDASAGGMELMHWVVGLDPIDLAQLKARYYEPGLLAKILGFNKERLRDVSAFDTVAMYPEIENDGNVDATGKLHLKLKNRGGGIGPVQVFVNGKELIADARGPKPNPNAPEASLTIDVSGATVLPGEKNKITVVARNAEGYLASRAFEVAWKPPGAAEDHSPELYAIVSGISEYSDVSLHLSFSSKDAEDMARALELGGTRLFGAGRAHVTLLSSSGGVGVFAPTKGNLRRAFESAQAAKPGDVLVVYLAGHGLAFHDMYIYPTEEARGLDGFSDPAIRNETGITSEELVDWIKKIPATHQVMILDTCAAGAAAAKLVEKRDVPSDQIRALDNLKDRTGFFVLMGSAADAVSYEASQYGQGLLTYSLLQGMRGAALKNDVEIDVNKLFQYAADRVPELARDVGGIQRPQILPGVGGSFDVGELQKEDKERIPLAAVKPLILRPVFLNARLHRDDLGLSAALRKRLRGEIYASARGGPGSATAVFVDETEFPGAIIPSGDYTVDGKTVKVTVVLSRDDKEITQITVEGNTDNPDALAAKIVQAILEASKKVNLQD